MQLQTIRELIDETAREYGEKTAFCESSGQTHSFTQVKRDADALAMYLVKNGYTGAHIGVWGPNSYAWVVAYLAITCGTGTVVPLPWGVPAQNVSKMIAQADVTLVLTDSSEELGCPKLPLTGLDTENAQAELPVPKPDDICKIIFTSGTTSVPKGVLLTQRSIMCIADCEREFMCHAGTVSISVLPASHAFESVCHILPLYRLGGTMWMCPSLMQFAPMLVSSGCDTLFLVPALAEALLTKLRRFFDKATNMKAIVCGGAPVSQSLVDSFKALGILMITGYGLSECSPLVSLNITGTPASIGRPGSFNKVRISDEGEIQVNGENLMRGYYKNPEATRAAFTEDGWLKTGDLGRIDKDGNLFLTGRIKNVIILSNGENVSPEELESLLIDSIDVVADALCYEKGDILACTLYVPEGDENVIKPQLDALNRTLPAFKRIMDYTVTREPLPANATGKKLR